MTTGANMTPSPSSQTPTPRTDSAWEGYIKDGPNDLVRIRYKTSCQLERELAEAKEDHFRLQERSGTTRMERDEARADRNQWKQMAESLAITIETHFDERYKDIANALSRFTTLKKEKTE